MVTPEQNRMLLLAKARRRRAEAGQQGAPAEAVLAAGEQMQRRPEERIAGAFEAAGEVPQNQVGTGEAIMRGAQQGASFGLSDEMLAGQEASGLPRWLDAIPGFAINRAVTGYARSFLDQGAADTLDTTLQQERDRLAAAREQHPIAAIGGEVGGALLTAPFAPAIAPLRAAGWTGRAAEGGIQGLGTAALYGFGSGEGGLQNRVENAADVAPWGGLGVVAAPAVEGGIAAARGLQRLNPLRGAIRPDTEASRRVVSALVADNGSANNVQAGASALPRLQAAGQPVVNADIGGEATGALARSAANTSPLAREALNEVVDSRFPTQVKRANDFLRQIVGDVDSVDLRDRLTLAARKANRPAYARAYAEGGAIWTPEVQQVAQAPVVQDAIRKATRTGSNKAAAEGFQPVRNPFAFNEQGVMSLRQNADGSQALPTLQFWDHVKRNLDDTVESLKRSGNKSEAADAAALREQLLRNLDSAAPSYARARSGAAAFFGAQDALEAGQKFVSSRLKNTEARRALAKMSPPERQLFEMGFTSDLMKAFQEAGDRNSILNSVFVKSPAARERVEIALGPQRAKQIEAFLRIEDIMDQLRKAVQGNSTTARQLAEMGLAGGAQIGGAGVAGAAYGLYTGDVSPAMGALLGIGARVGKMQIDRRLALRVAQMLASPDPQVFQSGLQRVASNTRLLDLLRASHSYLARAVSPQAAPSLYGSIPAAAQEDDQQR